MTDLASIPMDKLGALGVLVLVVVISSYVVIYKIVKEFVRRDK